MAFFDNISKKISDAGQVTIQKTKTLADVAKFSSMISDEERKMNNTYMQIGKEYVQKYGEEPAEEFKELVDLLKESESKIKEYQENIKVLKGVTNCPECGAEVQNESLFCPKCGTKMPQVEVVAEEAEETEEAVPKFCSKCGAAISAGSRFCVSCGNPVETIVDAEETNVDAE